MDISITDISNTDPSFLACRSQGNLRGEPVPFPSNGRAQIRGASGTTHQMPMVGKNGTPSNTTNKPTPDTTSTTIPVLTPTVTKTTSSPVSKDKTRSSAPTTRAPAVNAAASSSVSTTSTTDSSDTWTPVTVNSLTLTCKTLTGTFRFVDKNKTLIAVPMRRANGKIFDAVYCANWFQCEVFTAKQMTATCKCSEHHPMHCFKQLRGKCDGVGCKFSHIICKQQSNPARQPAQQYAKQPAATQRFAPLETLPESAGPAAGPADALYVASYPALPSKPTVHQPANQPAKQPAKKSYATTTTSSHVTSGKSKKSYASTTSSTTSSTSGKPANSIDWTKEKTRVCWFFLRRLPCPFAQKGKCAYSHKTSTRSLAGLGYREAFDIALKEGWIDFQSIFEEVFRVLRQDVTDLRTIHRITLDDSVSKFSYLLSIPILTLIENDEIEPCHFNDIVKMWYAVACIGRKQGYSSFVLFNDENGELENQVWELGRLFQTCNKDADFERYQTCYGVITKAIHTLNVPASIRSKHSRFFTIPMSSLCTGGTNCNHGSHKMNRVDTRRLMGLRIREEDDVKQTHCTDLATTDFTFPVRAGCHATATPEKVVSARTKLDAETTVYIRDLTTLIQNEQRISELVPVVPAEVAQCRTMQAQLDSTRTALSKAEDKKAEYVRNHNMISSGVTELATLEAEIAKKQKDAVDGPYASSQKEVTRLTTLKKLTKNSALRIAKFKADAESQTIIVDQLTTTKDRLTAEFSIINRIANRATVSASADIATQRVINELITGCDGLVESLCYRMRVIEKLNKTIATDELRGICPVTSYCYQPLRRLSVKADEKIVAKEIDINDEFFKVSSELAVCEQKRDFAILASRSVPQPVKLLAIAMPTTQSDVPTPTKPEPIDIVVARATKREHFKLSKRQLELIADEEEEDADIVLRNVYTDDTIACKQSTALVVRTSRVKALKPVATEVKWDECILVETNVEIPDKATSFKQIVQKVRVTIQMSCKDYNERVASLTRTIEMCEAKIPTLARSIAMYSDAIAEAKRDVKAIELTMESHLRNVATTLQISRNKNPAYQLTGRTHSEVKLREIQDGPIADCNARIAQYKVLMDDTQYRRNCLVAERRDAKSCLTELALVQPNADLDMEDIKVEYVNSARYNVFSVLAIDDDEPLVSKRVRVKESAVEVLIEPFTADMIEAFAGEMNVPTELPFAAPVAKIVKVKSTTTPSTKVTITVTKDGVTCKTTVSGILPIDLKSVCSALKTKCSTSCSVKKSEILINGSVHDIVKDYLVSNKIAVPTNIIISGDVSIGPIKASLGTTGKSKANDARDRSIAK